MRKFLRRLHFLLNRRRLERELAEEMEAHREMIAASHSKDFGNALRLREDARDVWNWVWLDQLWQDLIYAARTFRRSPGFTLGAIMVLTVGIGVNLAEFHIFDAIMLRRLSIQGAESIYRVTRNSKKANSAGFPAAAIQFYRENCTLCSWVVAENASDNLILDSDSEQRPNFVSGNYFPSLRITPAWGRLLDERDSLPGAPLVAVIGCPYFRRVWNADPRVVDRTVSINGKTVQIVGITPCDFDGLTAHNTTVWLPAGQRPVFIADISASDSAQAPEEMYVRPQVSVSLEAVQQQLTALTHQLAYRQPAYFRPDERLLGSRLPGTGFSKSVILNPAFLLLLSIILLVFLSACANLSNMLLARGLSRRHEIDIRIAVGAGRSRIIRQLLTENLLLATMGMVGGLLFGYCAARWMLWELDVPPDLRIKMDWQTLAAAVAFAVLSSLAFGLVPALRHRRANATSDLRRQVFIGIQVAVSCLLLIAAAVFTRNAILSATIDLRFDYQHMSVVYPQFYSQHLAPSVVREKLEILSKRLERLPGVDSVAAVVNPPLGPRFTIQHVSTFPPLFMNYVAPSYFATMNIPVLRGRSFFTGEQNALIVGESAARIVWPNQDAIGKNLDIESTTRTVVGIVKDSGANLLVDPESVEAYMPIGPTMADQSALILHFKGESFRLRRSIELVSASLGEPLAAGQMRDWMDRGLAVERRQVALTGSLGLIATVLAAAGMFALVAFAVAQRKNEIGIRMAIGARSANILWTLLKENLAPIAVGAMVGTCLALAGSRVLRSVAHLQNDLLDPIGLAFGLVAFALIAATATLLPALKALRIDPSGALKSDSRQS